MSRIINLNPFLFRSNLFLFTISLNFKNQILVHFFKPKSLCKYFKSLNSIQFTDHNFKRCFLTVFQSFFHSFSLLNSTYWNILSVKNSQWQNCSNLNIKKSDVHWKETYENEREEPVFWFLSKEFFWRSKNHDELILISSFIFFFFLITLKAIFEEFFPQ